MTLQGNTYDYYDKEGGYWECKNCGLNAGNKDALSSLCIDGRCTKAGQQRTHKQGEDNQECREDSSYQKQRNTENQKVQVGHSKVAVATCREPALIGTFRGKDPSSNIRAAKAAPNTARVASVGNMATSTSNMAASSGNIETDGREPALTGNSKGKSAPSGNKATSTSKPVRRDTKQSHYSHARTAAYRDYRDYNHIGITQPNRNDDH